MCLIDMNKLFEIWKTTCLLFILYVDYGFNNNNIHVHKASIFVHAHVD